MKSKFAFNKLVSIGQYIYGLLFVILVIIEKQHFGEVLLKYPIL